MNSISLSRAPRRGDRAGFGAQIAQAARLWRRVVDHRMRPFGLTEATWLPLLHLARGPAGMRQKELAASLSLDSSSVVRLLDALETAGLIERREDGADRRAKAIVLTPLGRATVAKVERAAEQVRGDALMGLAANELATASHVLKHVCRVLAPLADEPGP
jgi:MarR family transcriptional regulator, transcriptional regulator for hemolysin